MTAFDDIAQIVTLQKKSFISDEYPSAKLRRDRLDRLIALLQANKQSFCDALHADFGSRSNYLSVIADVLVTIESAKHCRKHTSSWMKPENRGARFPLGLLGAKAQVHYQPKGVVGIMSPWNFPVQLSFSPLANVLSAGNRAMIKPSELTPATSELMESSIKQHFSEEEIAVVTGGVDVAIDFSKQAFDHLIFTGGPSIAKHVAKAAAENLVPLTLELGGKCPVIISDDTDLASAVQRTMAIKLFNAGQICLAPDYVFIKAGLEDRFIELAKSFVTGSYDSFNDNDDYTSIINDQNFQRLQGYIEQAEVSNSSVTSLPSASGDTTSAMARKLAPTLLLNPSENLDVMKDEIFGPILPIKTYTDINEVIQYVNDGERPLALYYFGKRQSEIKALREKTTSGGMVVNDVLAHTLQDTLPLGGVGYSGMGSYHGFDGFKEFSHAKAYYKQGMMSMASFFKAPYTKSTLKLIEKIMG